MYTVINKTFSWCSPFSRASICAFVNDVRLRCSLRFNRNLMLSSSPPCDSPPVELLSAGSSGAEIIKPHLGCMYEGNIGSINPEWNRTAIWQILATAAAFILSHINGSVLKSYWYITVTGRWQWLEESKNTKTFVKSLRAVPCSLSS